jgi:predicted transcriptional regulator
MAGTYRLKIVYGDKQFEAEGDKTYVLDMWKKLQPRVFHDEKVVSEKKGQKDLPDEIIVTTPRSKGLSVGEFIRQLGFKKHTDIVLAFGYYLEKYSAMREFGPADINKCYYDAKIESSNTSQMLIQNIKRGHVMQARGAKKKGQKQYTLTRTGEEFVEKTIAKKRSV